MTSVYDVTPAIGGVLAISTSPSMSNPALGLDAVGEQLLDRCCAVTGDGGGATSIPSSAIAAIIRGIGARVVLDVERRGSESAGKFGVSS